VSEQTYDPILEYRELTSVRLLSPLRAPQPGRALVLVPHNGPPRTVHYGEAIPNARYGTYRYAFVVDVTEHRLLLEIPLLSRDPSFGFQGSVGLVCRVDDAAEVVGRGIHNVAEAIKDHIKRMLRQVSRDYDIKQFHEAEHALNTAVRDFTGDSAIRLRNISVELVVNEAEIIASGAEFREGERRGRLSAMRRDDQLAMLRREGAEGVLAEIMASEGPRAVWELMASTEADERAELMAAMKAILEHGDEHREPFDLVPMERAVIGRMLEGSGAPFGGTRPGRVRGIVRTELEAGRVLDDRDAERPRGVAGAVYAESPRATASPGDRHAEPPDDEPIGGTAGGDTDAGPPPGTSDRTAERRDGGAPRVSRIRGARPSADYSREERRQ